MTWPAVIYWTFHGFLLRQSIVWFVCFGLLPSLSIYIYLCNTSFLYVHIYTSLFPSSSSFISFFFSFSFPIPYIQFFFRFRRLLLVIDQRVWLESRRCIYIRSVGPATLAAIESLKGWKKGNPSLYCRRTTTIYWMPMSDYIYVILHFSWRRRENGDRHQVYRIGYNKNREEDRCCYRVNAQKAAVEEEEANSKRANKADATLPALSVFHHKEGIE